MSKNKLSTEPYKGVRDFYPRGPRRAQLYLCTWRRWRALWATSSMRRPSWSLQSLYKAKGAENEEMVNEQTYTFVDRGEREVTLRPEMTPTVARMVAG
jgi:histidyl-tRNA synthetase